MAFYDPVSGLFSEAARGADVYGAAAGEPGLLDSAANFVTKGLPLTGVAILNSFANTAVDIGNFFGGNYERMAVEDYISDTETLDYYKSHNQGIEAAGLILGSFIPGGLAVKGANASVKALYLAKSGYSPETLSRATGLLAPFKARVIQSAEAEIRASGALYNQFSADKLKLIGLGVADQTMQSLIWELATVATMKASPLLDNDGLSEIITNSFAGMMVGGVVGGAVEGIIANKLVNKMRLRADFDSKAEELSTRLGLGDFLPGDRAATLLASLDDLPSGRSILGDKKAAATRSSALTEVRAILNKAAGPGNEPLSNALVDVLVEGKASGAMTTDDIFDKLSRLAKISRIDDAPSVPTNDSFYLNTFLKKELGRRPTFADILTNDPSDKAVYSLRYRLREGATDVNIATSVDKLELPSGASTARYSNSKEAFEEGVDIFIDGRRQIWVNPDSANIERIPRPGEGRKLSVAEEKEFRKTGKLPEGSADLYSEPIVLNVKSKAMSSREGISPVVGDFGEVQLVDRGLVYGDKFVEQQLGTLITRDTAPLDANARYVWASMRGVKAGDTINVFDTAMLEAVYQDFLKSGKSWGEYAESALKRGVTLATGSGPGQLPNNLDTFLNMIRDAKDELIVNALSKEVDAGKKALSISDVGRLANVPEEYILGGLKARHPEEYILGADSHKTVNHIQLEYDLNNVLKDQDGNIIRGQIDVQYRVQQAQAAANSAAAAYFGEEFEKFIIKGKAAEASTEGSGPGLVTSANANYGTLAQRTEAVGRAVTAWIKQLNEETTTKLFSHMDAIKNDPGLAAEVGNFIAVRRRTAENYVFLPEDIARKHMRDGNTVVLEKALIKNKSGEVIDWDKSYTPKGFLPAAAKVDPNWVNTGKELHTFYDLSPRHAAFERANMELNSSRLEARTNWLAAQGMKKDYNPAVLYAPPIDTAKYPYFFFVKPLKGKAFADESPSVVTAANATELEAKAALLRDDYEIIYKVDNKRYREVLGDYEYDRNFASSIVNSDLKRRGILNDIFPDIRADSIARDYVDFHTRQNMRITRDYVELTNAQLFAEIHAMGQRFTAAETSRTGFVSALLGRTVPNPYNSYINTALAITDRGNYRLWAESNEKLEAFAGTAFNVAKTALGFAKKGILPFEEAAKLSQQYGLGNVYEAATDALKGYEIANRLPPRRYLSEWVSTAHSILAATAIRLDTFQSIINAVSTPILAMAEARSAIIAGKEYITTKLPGTEFNIPSVTKLISRAVTSYASNDAEKKALLPILRDIGAVRKATDLHEAMLSDLALPVGAFQESKFVQNMRAAVDKGSKLMGAELSEEFSRYVPGYMAHKIFGPEGLGYTGQQLRDNIATFVNRVQGNYTASQRPLLFQGPLGSAISLFQTYQFNLMQQVFRYIENGEAKTIAMMAGLQTTIFGLQGLPGFQVVNNHLVGNAAGNPAHKDIYTTMPNYLDKGLSDYVMYGVLSNWFNAGLYSRGDINPRNITILPVNPADFPAVAGATKFITALAGIGETLAKGGAPGPSLLLGLEHNGLSRPLTGLAQLMQGYVTTSKGNLVSTTRSEAVGWSDFFSLTNFARLAGARPLDEAVVMDAMYRKTLYAAKDNTRITALGEAVKTHLYANGTVDGELIQEFAGKYAAAGGNINNFSRKMMEWTKDANVSTANEIYTTLRQGHMQQLQQLMGGRRLPDFRNLGISEPAPVE